VTEISLAVTENKINEINKKKKKSNTNNNKLMQIKLQTDGSNESTTSFFIN